MRKGLDTREYCFRRYRVTMSLALGFVLGNVLLGIKGHGYINPMGCVGLIALAMFIVQDVRLYISRRYQKGEDHDRR